MNFKTIAAAPLLAGLLAAGSAFALDVDISGEVKTGFLFESREYQGTTYSHTRIHNNDGDSGAAEGRIRLGLNLTDEFFGIRTRFYQHGFMRGNSITDENILRVGMDYAYAYGNMFDSQLKISAGLLGESPWGSGGPELQRELESTNDGSPIVGIRTEWMPRFLPGLNVGFVLNGPDDTMPSDAKEKFGDILMESILGITYEHTYFAFSFAYRFDRGIDSPAAVVNGERFVYRIEEKFLRTLLPGMAIWVNGYGYGINAGVGSGRGIPGFIEHWLYITYDPEYLTTGINVKYHDGFVLDAQLLEFRPYFYYKLFDNFLVAGAMFGMEMGFNNGKSPSFSVPYNFWFAEPQVKLNINSCLYAAIVYRFTSGSYGTNQNEDQTTHWINLRLCYTF